MHTLRNRQRAVARVLASRIRIGMTRLDPLDARRQALMAMRADGDRVANRQVRDAGERCRHRGSGLPHCDHVQRAAGEDLRDLTILQRASDDTSRTDGVNAGAYDFD